MNPKIRVYKHLDITKKQSGKKNCIYLKLL